MPTCNNCDNQFPCRLEIDGKIRHLAGRKYCLECSPFGSHNTVPLHKRKNNNFAETECVCEVCGREYKYKRKSGHTLTKCNSCLVNCRRFELKKKMVEYKGGKCLECGYNRCYNSLDFHHRDPETKKFNLSGAHCRKWIEIQEELDKCDIVCANCHREIEAAKFNM